MDSLIETTRKDRLDIMRSRNKIVNYLLILGSLNLGLQSQACENVPSVNDEKLSGKRVRSQTEELLPLSKDARREENPIPIPKTPYSSSSPLEDPDLIAQIIPPLVAKNHHTVFVVNSVWNTIGMNFYKKQNEQRGDSPWQGKDLSERALFIFNSLMRTYLGLYANIKLQHSYDIDRVRFDRLYARLMSAPFFDKKDFPLQYIQLLQLDLAVKRPTAYQQPMTADFSAQLQNLKSICAQTLATIANAEDRKLQNETALYFHYIHFLLGLRGPKLDIIKQRRTRALSNPLTLFASLRGPCMDAMNERLLALKQTANLAIDHTLSVIWREILALEPAITDFQRRLAVGSFLHAHNNEWLADYYEEEIGTRKSEKGSPVENHPDLYEPYSTAIRSNIAIRNYNRAAQFLEELTNKSITAGGHLAEEFYFACQIYEGNDNRVKLVEYARRIAPYVESQNERHIRDNNGFCHMHDECYELAARVFSAAGDTSKSSLYYEETGQWLESNTLDSYDASTGEVISAIHYRIAQNYFKASKYGKAIDHALQYIETAGSEGTEINQDIHMLLSEAYLKVGNTDETVAAEPVSRLAPPAPAEG
jgi:hypothetical protein